jgi:hypothetical protein
LSPKDYLADAIEWFSNGDVSHTVTCLGDGVVIDAQPTGIKKVLLTNFLREDYRLTLRRLEVGDGVKVAQASAGHAVVRYDLKGLVGSVVFGLLGKMRMFPAQRWFGKKLHGSRCSYTCSEEYATAVWQGVGVDLAPGKDYDLVTPHDLLKHPLLKTIAVV